MPSHFVACKTVDAATVAVRCNEPVACSAPNVGWCAADLKADVAELYRFYAKPDGCATESHADDVRLRNCSPPA